MIRAFLPRPLSELAYPPWSVACDKCDWASSWLRFISRDHAEQWLMDNDEDFAEYGQFVDNVPRPTDLFHKIGSKLYCLKCVDAEIKKTKGIKDASV